MASRRRAAPGDRCRGRAPGGARVAPAGPLRAGRSAGRHAQSRRSFRRRHARAAGACVLPTAPPRGRSTAATCCASPCATAAGRRPPAPVRVRGEPALARAPIVAGVLFEDVVPARDEDRLVGLTLLLVAVAFGAAAFTVVQGIAWLRLEGLVSTSLQAAIWDRLLGLPVPFFRRYTSGDLTTRALGVDAIRDTLARATTTIACRGLRRRLERRAHDRLRSAPGRSWPQRS